MRGPVASQSEKSLGRETGATKRGIARTVFGLVSWDWQVWEVEGLETLLIIKRREISSKKFSIKKHFREIQKVLVIYIVYK